MKSSVEIYDDELRSGTWIIAEGFKREHYDVLKLIKKHKNRFLLLGKMPKHRLIREIAGRPVYEFMLNVNQITLLVALMRSTACTIKLFADILRAGDIAKVIRLLESFDTGEINVKYVYAMQDEFGNVKIGISNNPKRRLLEISACNSMPVKLLATKRCALNRYKDETILHKENEILRLKGEWFAPEAREAIQ